MKKAALVVVAALVLGGCKKKDEGTTSPQQPTQAQVQEQQQAAVKPHEQGQQQQAATGNEAKKIAGCNSDFADLPTTNTTLTAACSPYKLESDLVIEGWDLTIEPGVEVRMGADTTISVANGRSGRITAKGTAEKPIKFVSGSRKEPGSWVGFHLYQDAAGSEFQHVVIEHAGMRDEPALRNRTQDLKVSNVKFVGVKKRAYQEDWNCRSAVFSDNDFSEAGGDEELIEMAFVSTPAIKNLEIAKGKVILLVGRMQTDLSIPNPGVPYRVLESMSVEATEEGKTANITIAPGTKFQVGADAEWEFGYGFQASLKAVGTAEQPITWTRFGEAEKGSWRGLEFHPNSKPPQLVHVNIEYAGEKDGQAIHYRAPKGLGKLQFARISKSKGHAVVADEGDGEPFEAFSDNTFEDIDDSTLKFKSALATKLGGNNKFPDNGVIELEQNLATDVTLTAQPVPYLVLAPIAVEGQSDVKPASLTIEPGATLKFGPEGELSFGYNNPGALKALGAADKPITFTAATDAWKGLDFKDKGKLEIENAVFEKTADDHPAISVAKQAAGGTIKAVKFDAVKVPVRDCSKKVKAEGVKPSKTGC